MEVIMEETNVNLDKNNIDSSEEELKEDIEYIKFLVSVDRKSVV